MTEQKKPYPIWVNPLVVFAGYVAVGFVLPLHYTFVDRVKLGAVAALIWLALDVFRRRQATPPAT